MGTMSTMHISHEDLCEYKFENLSKTEAVECIHAPIILDTETAGFGDSKDAKQVIYFSWADTLDDDVGIGTGAGSALTQNGRQFLRAICMSPRPKVFHAITRDLEFLKMSDIPINMAFGSRGYCTLLAHALLDEYHPTHALDDLGRDILNHTRSDYFKLAQIQKSVKSALKNLFVPQDVMHPYALRDAEDTLALWRIFKHQLEQQGLWQLYETTMDAEVYGWYAMETCGIAFDREGAKEALHKILPAKREVEKQIYDAFGEKFLITSTKQLGNQLKKYHPLKPTKTGWSTSVESLRQFRDDPKVQMILAYKKLVSCKSKILLRLKTKKRRLFPDYNQTLVSGRTSCSKVPLQQISKRASKINIDDVGTVELARVCSEAYKATRRMWTVEHGATLVTFDLDQGEYRAAAHYTHSKRLIDLMCAPGADFHMIVTKMVFPDNNDPAFLSGMRDILKHVSFGLLYMMSEQGIERTIEKLSGKALSDLTSYTPATIMKKYEAAVPEMRELQQRILNMYFRNGYVKDVFGRRYRKMPRRHKITKGTDDYAIVNYVCQGTVGNIKRIAIARLGKFFHQQKTDNSKLPMRSNMVLDIHDELGFEIYPEDSWIIPVIHEAMTTFPQLSIPITTSPNVGPNLLDMQEMTVEEAIQVVASGELARRPDDKQKQDTGHV